MIYGLSLYAMLFVFVRVMVFLWHAKHNISFYNIVVWFYWMFYDHFSARSLLAKLGRYNIVVFYLLK